MAWHECSVEQAQITIIVCRRPPRHLGRADALMHDAVFEIRAGATSTGAVSSHAHMLTLPSNCFPQQPAANHAQLLFIRLLGESLLLKRWTLACFLLHRRGRAFFRCTPSSHHDADIVKGPASSDGGYRCRTRWSIKTGSRQRGGCWIHPSARQDSRLVCSCSGSVPFPWVGAAGALSFSRLGA